MVVNNPPNSLYRHARLMHQAQSPDPHTHIPAQQRLAYDYESLFKKAAKGKDDSDAEEAVQSARVAFALNFLKYNIASGVLYSTYVRKMMVREIARNERLNDGRPSAKHIQRWADADGVTKGEVVIPVWTSTGEPNEFDEATTLEDSIPDNTAAEAFAISGLQMDVQRFVNSLTPIEKEVYRLLYKEQKTQAVAADALGITQPRVNQVNAKILHQGKACLAHLVAVA